MSDVTDNVDMSISALGRLNPDINKEVFNEYVTEDVDRSISALGRLNSDLNKKDLDEYVSDNVNRSISALEKLNPDLNKEDFDEYVTNVYHFLTSLNVVASKELRNRYSHPIPDKRIGLEVIVELNKEWATIKSMLNTQQLNLDETLKYATESINKLKSLGK